MELVMVEAGTVGEIDTDDKDGGMIEEDDIIDVLVLECDCRVVVEASNQKVGLVKDQQKMI